MNHSVIELIQKANSLGILNERKLVGCSENEILEMMQAQGVSHLPQEIRDFYRICGKGAGNLLVTESVYYPQILENKDHLGRMLRLASKRGFITLPKEYYVFYCHDGYQFYIVNLDQDEANYPIYWIDDEPSIDFKFHDFLDFLNREIYETHNALWKLGYLR